jgi:hypothetical protein
MRRDPLWRGRKPSDFVPISALDSGSNLKPHSLCACRHGRGQEEHCEAGLAPAPSSLPAVVGGASGVVECCGESGWDLLRGQPVHLLEQGPGSGGCAQNAAARYGTYFWLQMSGQRMECIHNLHKLSVRKNTFTVQRFPGHNINAPWQTLPQFTYTS